jgi:hypothetical protein
MRVIGETEFLTIGSESGGLKRRAPEVRSGSRLAVLR